METPDSNGAGGAPPLIRKALSTLKAADDGLKQLHMQFRTTQQRVRQDICTAVVSTLTSAKHRSRSLRPAFASVQASSDRANSLNDTDREETLMVGSRAATRPTGQVSASLWGPKQAPGKRDDPPVKENAPEPSFLIGDVVISGADGDELAAAKAAVTLPRNFHATETDMIAARDSVASTGLFSAIEMGVYRDRTGDGHVLEFRVQPNAEFKGHKVTGSRVLPEGLVDDIFHGARGRTSDFNLYNKAANRIEDWYRQNGIFGNVKDDIDTRKKSLTTGEYVFDVEEVEIGEVRLRFVDKKGNEVKGKTKPDLLKRYIRTGPGEVLRTGRLHRDLKELNELDVFETVNIVPMVPATKSTTTEAAEADSDKTQAITDLEYQLAEKSKFGSWTCQGGATVEGSLAGLEPIGMAAYVNNNVMGMLQRVSAMFTMRKWSDRCFELSWAVPWLQGSERRISQTAAAAITRHNQDPIFGPALDEVSRGDAAAGGHTSVTVERSHLQFDRSASLSDTVYGTVGGGVYRCRCVDEAGTTLLKDPYQWPLAHSVSGRDKALKLYSSLVLRRENLAARVSAERSLAIPKLLNGWLQYTRADGQAMAQFLLGHVGLLRLSGSGGVQRGDLPAYDAHPLGGVNCVRGYAEGALGTARHWGVINTELETAVPKLEHLKGLFFLDCGTDFNSGQTVVGDPAGSRMKPGTGFGYGLGVRFGSPMGMIRFEYGWTGDSQWGTSDRWIPSGRLHVGIGSRF